MKYMVMVNGKYMTQVETDRSACGAEHIILDDIRYGITSAQAFDQKAMKTEHFFACFQSCEMISLDELKRMSDAAKAELDKQIEKAQSEYDEITAQIEELQKKQREAKWHLNIVKGKNGREI